MVCDMSKQSVELEERILTAVTNKQWEDASGLKDALLKSGTDRPSVFLGCIEACLRCNAFDDAIELKRQTEARFPGSPAVKIFCAEFDARSGEWESAALRFHTLMVEHPELKLRIQRNPVYRQAIINWKGIIEGNRFLSLQTHEPDSPDEDGLLSEKDYLFVSGMPRSGTTALGQLLMAFSKVQLFTELHNPYLAYDQSSFSSEALNRRSRITKSAFVDGWKQRLEEAELIGDKRPLFHCALPQTALAMNGRNVTVLHILRNPFHVTSSYSTRAHDPSDGWDPLRAAKNCIDEFNVMNEFVCAWERNRQAQESLDIIYVDYERVFSDANYASGIIERAGVASAAESQKIIENFHDRSKRILSKNRKIPEDIRRDVEQNIDWELVRDVVHFTNIEAYIGERSAI